VLIRHTLKLFNKRICAAHEPYISSVFRPIVGYAPNVALPLRYHEKLLWRKLFDRNPLFVTFSDKLATKEYMRQRAPGLKVPETLWNGQSIADAPDSLFREKVFFKCNHGCAFNYYWDGTKGNFDEAQMLTKRWLRTLHGADAYEWAYSGVAPTIYAERLIGTRDEGVIDINIRCADGEPIVASLIRHNKSPRKQAGYYDIEGRRLFPSQGPNPAAGFGELPADFPVPGVFHQAVGHARELSRGVDYARFDFMTDARELFGGEITVYPASGHSKATTGEEFGIDKLVNEHWDIGKSWFINTPQHGWKNFYRFLLRSALRHCRA
jgi:hypothetical protein